MKDAVVYFMGGPMDLSKRIIEISGASYEVLERSGVGRAIYRHSYSLVPMPVSLCEGDRVYVAMWNSRATRVELP
jgi:hypothetical protein